MPPGRRCRQAALPSPLANIPSPSFVPTYRMRYDLLTAISIIAVILGILVAIYLLAGLIGLID